MKRKAINIIRLVNQSPFIYNRNSEYEDFYQLIKENENLRTIMEKPTFAERIEKFGSVIGRFTFTSMPNMFLNLSDFLCSKPIEFVRKPSIVVTWKNNARESIKNNVKHYIHGFHLLLKDVQQTLSIFRKVASGRSITRREQKQSVRTIFDLFRIVPVSIMIMLPVLEFLIPFIVKAYPNFLPSQFIMKDELKERKTLQAKIELAKFLKTTVEMMLRKDGQDSLEAGLPQFLKKIRQGVPIPPEEISKYSQLFRDELTLDHLDRTQLVAMCKFMDITPVGNDMLLRFQIRNHLRKVKKDDRLIYWEGVGSLNQNELIIANKDRGMRIGVDEKSLRRQLTDWLKLSIEHSIPSSLLILSRTFSYLEETEKQKEKKKKEEEEEKKKEEEMKKKKKKSFPQSQSSGDTMFIPPPEDSDQKEEQEQEKKKKKKKMTKEETKTTEEPPEILEEVEDAILELTEKTNLGEILSKSGIEDFSNTERLDLLYEEENKIQEERENLKSLLKFIKDEEESYYMRKFLVKQLEAVEKKMKKESDELEKMVKELDLEMSSAHSDLLEMDEKSQKKIARVNKRLVRLMADIYGDIKTIEGEMEEKELILEDIEPLDDEEEELLVMKKELDRVQVRKEEEEGEVFDPGIILGELEEIFKSRVPEDVKEELYTKFIDEELSSDEMMSELVKRIQEDEEISQQYGEEVVGNKNEDDDL